MKQAFRMELMVREQTNLALLVKRCGSEKNYNFRCLERLSLDALRDSSHQTRMMEWARNNFGLRAERFSVQCRIAISSHLRKRIRENIDIGGEEFVGWLYRKQWPDHFIEIQSEDTDRSLSDSCPFVRVIAETIIAGAF
jgi:hypothetical protein